MHRRRFLKIAAASPLLPIILKSADAFAFTGVGEMNVPRSNHTATLLPDGKVLIAGGRRGWREDLASAELYEPSLRKFVPTGNLGSARGAHTATLLRDGKVLITGGFQPGETLASAELYDPSSGTFTPTASMSEPRQEHTATLLSDGRVLIAGGCNATGIRPTAELYEPASAKFIPTGDMTSPRMLHHAAAVSDRYVLVVGGLRGGGPNFFFSGHNFLDSAELYEADTGRFISLSGTGSGNDSAVVLADGRVLVAGGVESEVVVANARLYEPAQRRFVRAASMTSERFLFGATRLKNGAVLVTGGFKTFHWPPIVVATAESYDPKRDVFSRLPDMTTPRMVHTSTLLPDGDVLIAGGERGSYLALSSAELFHG